MNDIIHIAEPTPNQKHSQYISFLTPPQILVLGFLALILSGALLLTLPQTTLNGEGLEPINALFTATSAVCVTGLTVVDTGTTFNMLGQTIILVLIQFGGLGFMTIATLFAIILGKKIRLKERMVLKEALNQVSLEGVVRLAKYVFRISLILEALGAGLLTLNWSREMGFAKALYFGIFHSVSAFNNAGFDIFGNFSSLTSRAGDPVTNFTVMFLIITGGLGFAVLSDLYANKGKKLTFHSKIVLWTSLLLILSGTLIIFLFEYNNPETFLGFSTLEKLLASLFQSVTSRTAGFNTIDLAGMRDSTQIILILLMFIGASPGSTGGGIKTTTFMTLCLIAVNAIKGKEHITFRERTISKEIINKAVVLFLIALALVFAVTLCLSLTEGSDVLSLAFETVSAFGTVGLSLGITPGLTSLGKLALIFTMFCGRIGPVTLGFALSLKHHQNRGINHIKYPEEKMIIG